MQCNVCNKETQVHWSNRCYDCFFTPQEVEQSNDKGKDNDVESEQDYLKDLTDEQLDELRSL